MDAAALKKLWTVVGLFLLFYTLNAMLQSQGGGLLFKAVLLDSREVPNAYFSIMVCGFLLILLCIIGIAYASLMRANPRFGRWPVIGLENLDFLDRRAKAFQAFFLVVFVALPLYAIGHFWDELRDYGALHWKQEVFRIKDQAGVVAYVQKDCSKPVASIEFKSAGVTGALQAGGGYCLGNWQGGEGHLMGVLNKMAADDKRVAPYSCGSATPPTYSGDAVSANPCKDSDNPDWFGGVEWVPYLSPLALVVATLGAILSTLMFGRAILGR